MLFNFSCMNNCVGGINRRRLLIVFTLEKRSPGRILGRQAVDIKVCRCRDWHADGGRAADWTGRSGLVGCCVAPKISLLLCYFDSAVIACSLCIKSNTQQ